MPFALNPNATASLGFRGLSIFCYNRRFNGGQGRWEIAVPHFPQHVLSIELPGVTLNVESSIKIIAIKARIGVPPAKGPIHQPGKFNRRDIINTDRNHFGWLTDFTNKTEIPHGDVSIIKKGETPPRPGITMIYVYQALGYTKKLLNHPLVLATQRETCPIENGLPKPLPNDVAGRVLDAIRDNAAFGYAADTVGLDIEGGSGGEGVDIIFDNGLRIPIEKGSQPQEVTIQNIEPKGVSHPDAIVKTAFHNHGRGDFFHYYKTFKVTGEPRHLWGRFPPDGRGGPQPARTGDCNGVVVNFDDLDAFLD